MDDSTKQGCGCAQQSQGQNVGGIPMPQVTFSTFILSLASSALMQLGEVPNPDTGQVEEDLRMARHTIDILDMLRSKTQACLDAEETRLLDGILYEVRMKYVIKTR